MILFVKVRQIGNKFILEDNEGNNIYSKKFIDTREEAEHIAQQMRYSCINEDEDEENYEDKLGKGMFWEWWDDLCKTSAGDNLLCFGYFWDKAYNPRKENLEEYLDRFRR